MTPAPFSVEAVKSSWMQKEAEFEYTGINVDDVQFTPEGTTLTLSQEGKSASVTFSYSDDVGPFASVKSGEGESINLDLTPLSPPIVDSQIGKLVDMNLSWMTVEAFEGIVSAAGMQPVEIDPNAPPDSLGSQGSGASTPTSELPQQKTAELDAKTVPAPTPRGGIPGESLYSDGKSRYYPGIKMDLLNEEDPKSKGFYHRDASDFKVGDEVETNRGERGEVDKLVGTRYVVVKISDHDSVTAIPAHGELKHVNEAMKEVKVSDLDVPTQHQIKIAKKTLTMSDVGARIMGGMTREEAKEILKKYGLLPKSEESMYADGTSKYHPGLKQEAIHRVTWGKGRDVFVTDVDAGSEKEASKKVKDSVKADKIISVGKPSKESEK